MKHFAQKCLTAAALALTCAFGAAFAWGTAAVALAADVADLTFEGLDDVSYTGSAITPITVKDGGYTLEEGEDYTISYSDNIHAGIATAEITGMGAYTGTAQKSFTITRASNSWISTPADPYWLYGSTTPGLTYVPAFGTPVYTYYPWSFSEPLDAIPTEAGTYLLKAEVEETSDYCGLNEFTPFAILYPITSGKNATWTPGSTEGLTFTCTGPSADVFAVGIDFIEVDNSTYSLAQGTDGSTVITLPPDLLESLSNGQHTLNIAFGNDTAYAEDAPFFIGTFYAITSGNGAVWTKGSSEGLTFVCEGPFADLSEVLIDNMPWYYCDVSEGSTVVTLDSFGLNSLEYGSHTFQLAYTNNDYSETAAFTVARYEITAGDGAVWVVPYLNPDDSVLGCAGPAGLFSALFIDDTEVPSSRYFIEVGENGNTVAGFIPGYLEELTSGSHSFRFKFIMYNLDGQENLLSDEGTFTLNPVVYDITFGNGTEWTRGSSGGPVVGCELPADYSDFHLFVDGKNMSAVVTTDSQNLYTEIMDEQLNYVENNAYVFPDGTHTFQFFFPDGCSEIGTFTIKAAAAPPSGPDTPDTPGGPDTPDTPDTPGGSDSGSNSGTSGGSGIPATADHSNLWTWLALAALAALAPALIGAAAATLRRSNR